MPQLPAGPSAAPILSVPKPVVRTAGSRARVAGGGVHWRARRGPGPGAGWRQQQGRLACLSVSVLCITMFAAMRLAGNRGDTTLTNPRAQTPARGPGEWRPWMFSAPDTSHDPLPAPSPRRFRRVLVAWDASADATAALRAAAAIVGDESGHVVALAILPAPFHLEQERDQGGGRARSRARGTDLRTRQRVGRCHVARPAESPDRGGPEGCSLDLRLRRRARLRSACARAAQ